VRAHTLRAFAAYFTTTTATTTTAHLRPPLYGLKLQQSGAYVKSVPTLNPACHSLDAQPCNFKLAQEGCHQRALMATGLAAAVRGARSTVPRRVPPVPQGTVPRMRLAPLAGTPAQQAMHCADSPYSSGFQVAPGTCSRRRRVVLSSPSEGVLTAPDSPTASPSQPPCAPQPPEAAAVTSLPLGDISNWQRDRAAARRKEPGKLVVHDATCC
jgi:hypothetical protein